jgi:phage terminase large subunit GpA-like protein
MTAAAVERGRVVRAWVAGVLAGIYSPEPDEEIWEWAERTLRIPATENEEMGGMHVDFDLSPYVRPLMHWVRRPGKGEFWVRKSSQVGFTMAVLVIICWMMVHRPGNVGYAVDTLDEARKISKTRLQRWIKQNGLLDEMGESEDAISNLTYYLRGMTVYMLGAFSPGGWANKSITLFILDEVDKHPYIEGEGTTVALARERIKRPKNAKIIGFCTPGETGQIQAEWARGTREEWRFPFPCCGHEQALKWENFTFGTKEFKDLAGGYLREVVEREAYFRCELCGGKLKDGQKKAAMKHGRAVATAEIHGRVRSMHVWDAYSNFVTFGQLALEWIDAQGDETLLERYYRGRRGEVYEKHGRTLKHADILACRAGYARGTVPFRPLLLMQLVDIQGDVQKAVKLAVDSKENLWVVDWFVSLSLTEAAEWHAEPVLGPGGEEFVVTDGMIDEGHRTADVRRLCLESFLGVFWPVKGAATSQVRETISTFFPTVPELGEEICCYRIAEDQFKWKLLRMIADRDKRAKKGEPQIFFPADVEDDPEFMGEMIAERPVKKKNSLGRETWVWEKKGPNDFWDCVKYGLALWAVKRLVLTEQLKEAAAGGDAPAGDFDTDGGA